jgi:multidrug efflux system outer membrane protein
MRPYRYIALLALTLTAAGCAARSHTSPEPARAALPALDPALFSASPYDPRWWTEFEDPALDALEAAALEVNHDIRIAIARVQQARAIFDDTNLDRYPTVTAGASVDRRDEVRPGFSDEPLDTTTYRAGFDAFWELDLFGRVRAQIRAAAADADAFEASLDDVRVLVAAEVARAYFELRGLQHRLAVAQKNLENQRQTLRLTEVRRDAGYGETFDVASAAARVAAIEASLPPLRTGIAVREHRLAVLTAARPGALAVDVSPRPYPPLAKALPVGDPTELLRRRPDVRAAERRSRCRGFSASSPVGAACSARPTRGRGR